MSDIAVVGAGAFGTSLALALALDGANVALWGRDATDIGQMARERVSGRRLPGHTLPDSLMPIESLDDVAADICLLAVPMQQLLGVLGQAPGLQDKALIACCKGVDQATGLGPVETILAAFPGARAGLLTGPSFASDIASGLPTALVLATSGDAEDLQLALTRPRLRVYRTDDIRGAELGGALKNVVALAAGMAIGAGLGDSARASIIARGFAEMTRYATAKGAKAETLAGLSGLGDLVLTCTSEKSRNFRAGQMLAKGTRDLGMTVEGIPTAGAVSVEADRLGLDMPLTGAVAAISSGAMDMQSAMDILLSRPAAKE